MDPQSPQSASPVDRRQKYPSPSLFLALLAFLLLLSTGFLAYQNVHLQKQITSIQTQLQSSPTPSPIPDETKNWQTYTNTAHGFSFRYPTNWVLRSFAGSQQTPEESDSFTLEGPYENIDTMENGNDFIIAVNVSNKLPNEVNNEEKIIAAKEANGQFIVFTITSARIPPIALNTELFDRILATFNFTNDQSLTFPKKHFLTTDKFFENTPYPNELTSLKESDLLGFTCSNKYYKQADNSYVFFDNTSQQHTEEVLDDQRILKFLSSKEKGITNGSVSSVMTCKTESDNTIISYEITSLGGGVGASVNYGYFNEKNTTVAEIPMEKGPYFSCSDILAITKFNTLYVICGAGDGGFGSKSLYRVGLMKAYASDLLLKCTSIMADESSTPKITCGITQ